MSSVLLSSTLSKNALLALVKPEFNHIQSCCNCFLQKTSPVANACRRFSVYVASVPLKTFLPFAPFFYRHFQQHDFVFVFRERQEGVTATVAELRCFSPPMRFLRFICHQCDQTLRLISIMFSWPIQFVCLLPSTLSNKALVPSLPLPPTTASFTRASLSAPPFGDHASSSGNILETIRTAVPLPLLSRRAGSTHETQH